MVNAASDCFGNLWEQIQLVSAGSDEPPQMQAFFNRIFQRFKAALEQTSLDRSFSYEKSLAEFDHLTTIAGTDIRESLIPQLVIKCVKKTHPEILGESAVADKWQDRLLHSPSFRYSRDIPPDELPPPLVRINLDEDPSEQVADTLKEMAVDRSEEELMPLPFSGRNAECLSDLQICETMVTFLNNLKGLEFIECTEDSKEILETMQALFQTPLEECIEDITGLLLSLQVQSQERAPSMMGCESDRSLENMPSRTGPLPAMRGQTQKEILVKMQRFLCKIIIKCGNCISGKGTQSDRLQPLYKTVQEHLQDCNHHLADLLDQVKEGEQERPIEASSTASSSKAEVRSPSQAGKTGEEKIAFPESFIQRLEVEIRQLKVSRRETEEILHLLDNLKKAPPTDLNETHVRLITFLGEISYLLRLSEFNIRQTLIPGVVKAYLVKIIPTYRYGSSLVLSNIDGIWDENQVLDKVCNYWTYIPDAMNKQLFSHGVNPTLKHVIEYMQEEVRGCIQDLTHLSKLIRSEGDPSSFPLSRTSYYLPHSIAETGPGREMKSFWKYVDGATALVFANVAVRPSTKELMDDIIYYHVRACQDLIEPPNCIPTIRLDA